MQYGFLKAVAATPTVVVADCFHNQNEILSLFEKSCRDGAKLLILPELCITGYTCGDLFLQTSLQKASEKAVGEILRQTADSDMLVVVGAPVCTGPAIFNCALVMQNGRILGAVPKTQLPNYGEFYEKRIFASAPEGNCHIDYLGARIPFGNRLLFKCDSMPSFILGIEICEDMWSSLPPSTYLAAAGATVIANLSASDEAVCKSAQRKMMVQSQSNRQTCAYLFSSAGDGESTTDVVFSGHDMIFENGVLLDEAKPFQGGYCVSEIDLNFLCRERQRFAKGAPNDASFWAVPFSLDIVETRLTREFWKTPFVPDTPEECESRTEEILNIQSHGLKKRLEHTRAQKALIGISGGLDSALALIVTKRALSLLNRPETDILAVTMPCYGTSGRTKNNALALCRALGVPCRSIDITPSVALHLKQIGHSSDAQDAAFENAQARERTQVLMDLANMENGIVIGTGDLSELALGFSTYNGDHMSMYGVNADVPKTMIRAMLRCICETASPELAAVLLDIVDTPVSPELLPGRDGQISQVTEDIVGPYELHDFFLYHMVRRGEGKEKILRLASYAFDGEYAPQVLERWLETFYRRFFSQQFKRSCSPDGPRVGSVALSPRGDWRMPSDASSNVWRNA